MKIQNSRRACWLELGIMVLILVGCQSAPQAEPVREKNDPAVIGMADETQRVADAALGKQSEIIAQGDLAGNGLEQLLVVNRFAKAPGTEAGPENPSAIFITRGVILEKSNGKWVEILRCDEHLKNPNGYLGGSPADRVTGWRLEYRTDKKRGLEIKFTPVENEAGNEGAGMGELASQAVVVRWNAKSKRYQSLDPSREGYLSEAPTLETPHSILR